MAAAWSSGGPAEATAIGSSSQVLRGNNPRADASASATLERITAKSNGSSLNAGDPVPMSHARTPKLKHHKGAPEEHARAHQEAIHRATISQLLKPVADPDHPGQLIPLCELEQRERARCYRMGATLRAQQETPGT